MSNIFQEAKWQFRFDPAGSLFWVLYGKLSGLLPYRCFMLLGWSRLRSMTYPHPAILVESYPIGPVVGARDLNIADTTI